ncbi:MAG: efflux RND transporter periplasmic adaptor subunit [Ginsengibacter sp.]
MNFNKNIYRVAVSFSLLVFIACNGSKDKNAAAAAAANMVKDYAVITIEPRSFTLNSDYPATIEGQQNVEIRPKIDGYIEKIYVDEGSSVTKGQILFKISAPQFEQAVRTARADIQIALANVNAAQMDVNKVQPLVTKNIISKYELENAQFTLQAKRAALAQANASLANARTNLGYTSITSPVNGVVGVIPYKIGSLISSNTALPLTTVSNIQNIYAYFSINEKVALAFSKNTAGINNKAKLATMPPVSLILANGNELPEKGRITTASGLINTETGSLRVRATFPNPNRNILSGSSGAVRIPVPLDSAIVIPQKSTFEIQGKKFVYVVDTGGKVKSTPIIVSQNSGGQFFVVESGLKPGDQIVYDGVASLKEGDAIKPKAANSDSIYKSDHIDSLNQQP